MTRGNGSSRSWPIRRSSARSCTPQTLVESVNYQTRKASKTRGHFPDDNSALKLLRLIARDLTTTRGGVAGTGTQGWKEALNAFEIYLPRRLTIC